MPVAFEAQAMSLPGRFEAAALRALGLARSKDPQVVLRVERDGHGPYRDYGNRPSQVDSMIGRHIGPMWPTLWNDKGLITDEERKKANEEDNLASMWGWNRLRFGFSSYKQYRDWFSAQDREALEAGGYRVSVYVVGGHYVRSGSRQALFDLDSARLISTLPPLEVEAIKEAYHACAPTV